MKTVYNKYKDYKVKYSDCTAKVVGYNENMLIGVTQSDVPYSFKRLKNDSYVDTTIDYKHPSYRFVYVNESTILKQIREEKFTTPLKIEDNTFELPKGIIIEEK